MAAFLFSEGISLQIIALCLYKVLQKVRSAMAALGYVPKLGGSFILFGRAVDGFVPKSRLSLPVDKQLVAFLKEIGGQDPRQSCLAFKNKYAVNLPRFNKDHIIRLTGLFRRIFPLSKIESQKAHFLEKNRNQNPFSLQWSLLTDQIRESPQPIIKHLFSLLEKGSSFDERRVEIKAVLDAAPQVVNAVAREALSHSNPRLFNLLVTSCGYKPSGDDVEFILNLRDPKQKNLLLGVIVDKASGVPPEELRPKTFSRTALEPLLASGYKPTANSFSTLLGNMPSRDIPASIGLFLSCGYMPTQKDMHSLHKKILPEDIIPCFTQLFSHGYQPSHDDVKWAVKEVPFGMKSAFLNQIRSYTSDFCLKLDLNFWYNVCRLEEIIASPPARLSPEDVAAVVHGHVRTSDAYDERWMTCELTPRQKRYYYSETPFTHEVLDAVLQFAPRSFDIKKPEDFLTLYPSAAKEIFRAVFLSKHLAATGDTKRYLKKLVPNYDISSADFRCALDNACSPKILSLLLSTRVRRREVDIHESFHSPWAGWVVERTDLGPFMPSAEDLAYAEVKGCSQEVLSLIKSPMENNNSLDETAPKDKISYLLYSPYNPYSAPIIT